jgi:PhnB protein
MADTTDRSPRVVPYLYYENVERALRWLEDAFGFRESKSETLRGPDGTIQHTAADLEGARVMLGRPHADYRNPKRLGQTTQNLYVQVRDVAEHFARAKRAGAKLLSELEDTFYGDRRYGVEDVEGHHWYFAQAVNKVDPRDWRPTPEQMKGHG